MRSEISLELEYLSGKAQYQTNFQGLNFAVCADRPALVQ